MTNHAPHHNHRAHSGLNHEKPSPSNDKSKEERYIESQYPGLTYDENFQRIISTESIDKLTIVPYELEDKQIISVYLGGEHDVTIEVEAIAEAPVRSIKSRHYVVRLAQAESNDQITDEPQPPSEES
jgi:hypothetical protein